MAENTTTYTAVIDVQTPGADKIKEVGDNAEQAGEKFTKLQRQIRDTQVALQKAAEAGDEVQFKKLKAQLDELEDGLEAVQLKSKQFDDALAGLPGPAGVAGNAIKSVDGAFKILAANPVVAIIGALVGTFLLLKESLSKTERGQELLNKASEAFGKILGPIFAIIESVAFPIFEYLVGLLDKVAAGFNWLAKSLGIGSQQIEEASRNSSEVLKQQYEDQQKAEEEARKAQEEAAKKRAEAQKAAAEKRKKQLEDEAKERKRLQDEAEKVLVEAYISTLSERDKEIYRLGQKQNERLLALQKAGITDLTSVQEQYRIELAAINKKYDDEEAKRKEEEAKKEKERKDKELEEEKERLEKLAEAESQARADKAARIMAEYEFTKAQRAVTFQEELTAFDQTRNLEREDLVARKASADAIVAFDKATAAQRIQIERAQQETKLGIISDALGTLAEAVGRETVAGKALAIGQATINTYMGATKALATYPPPFGAIAAATVIAAGLLQVRKIVATKLPEIPKPGGGSVSTSGGGGGVSIATPSLGQVNAPQLGAGGGVNPNQQIAQTIAMANQRPIKTYVVSTEMSSQQALDRRTNTAAVL